MSVASQIPKEILLLSNEVLVRAKEIPLLRDEIPELHCQLLNVSVSVFVIDN